MPEVQYKVDLPAFTGRNVPIKEIAQAMGKDAQYVRVGLQQGILKFGTAIKVVTQMSSATIVRIRRFGKRQVTSEMYRKRYRLG